MTAPMRDRPRGRVQPALQAVVVGAALAVQGAASAGRWLRRDVLACRFCYDAARHIARRPRRQALAMAVQCRWVRRPRG